MLPNTNPPNADRWSDPWLLPLLLDTGVLASEDENCVLASSAPTIWSACVRSGLLSDESILAAVARRFALPIFTPAQLDVAARNTLQADFAHKHRVAPLYTKGRILSVAVDDPMTTELEPTIAFASGRPVRLVLASPDQLNGVLERLYPQREATDAPEVTRVLIADDDRMVRRMFKAALERSGFATVEVVDGQAAVDLLRRVHVDAMLLDINMPNLDGYGVLKTMSDKQCPRVPVIVATGHDDPAVAEWARDLGAEDVVTKPIEPRVLAARVEALFTKIAA